MFYACFTLIGSWEGQKNFRVGIFLNKNLLGQCYRKQKTFFLGLMYSDFMMDPMIKTFSQIFYRQKHMLWNSDF